MKPTPPLNQEVTKKIAVLGGGISALSAVFELTNDPDWKRKYDITVYQMGWRIGGKGASGRNPFHNQRIEEHGLHVWFGCYDNAFDLLRKSYEENNRPLGSPLSTLEEAFEPAHSFVCMEEVKGEWVQWPIKFPSNQKRPGIDEEPPSIWEMVMRMMDMMFEGIMTAHITNATGSMDLLDEKERKIFEGLHDSFMAKFRQMSRMMGINEQTMGIYDMVRYYQKFLEGQNEEGRYELLTSGIQQIRKWLWNEIGPNIETSHVCRRIWIMFDLIAANIIGIIEDGVIHEGFEAINDQDYREWVAKFSSTPKITAWSPVVQAFYSVNFSGFDQHTFEAGTALMGALRIALTYKGAYFYRMNAGMGDVVFTPIYEVLKKRGVQFKFFHRVEALHLDPNKAAIESIDITLQAKPLNGEYDPLVNVRGLPSWPSYPIYDRLENGQQLKDSGINLESPFEDHPGQEAFILQKGTHFDQVILGIPVAALKMIAKELIEEKQEWKEMVEKVTTTPTLATQLWLKPDAAGLGWKWPHLGRSISGTYALPFETNCDLSNLLIREEWEGTEIPQHISYLCGKLDVDPEKISHREALEQVYQYSLDYLDKLAGDIWPSAVNGDGFNYDLLADPSGAKGPERLKSQYVRANTDPSELYVLSEKNNSKFRLKPGNSLFRDLFLAGDWTDNGFNAGCIEASVMSGKQAARALSGRDIRIPGEKIVPGGKKPTEKAKFSASGGLMGLYKYFFL